ncbi:MAG: hypothetical protein ABIA63_07490, partial [bacterium]
MKKLIIPGLLAAIFFLNTGQGFCLELSPALMYEQEKGEVLCYNKETQKQRSTIAYTIEKELRQDKVIYKFTSHG